MSVTTKKDKEWTAEDYKVIISLGVAFFFVALGVGSCSMMTDIGIAYKSSAVEKESK